MGGLCAKAPVEPVRVEPHKLTIEVDGDAGPDYHDGDTTDMTPQLPGYVKLSKEELILYGIQ